MSHILWIVHFLKWNNYREWTISMMQWPWSCSKGIKTEEKTNFINFYHSILTLRNENFIDYSIKFFYYLSEKILIWFFLLETKKHYESFVEDEMSSCKLGKKWVFKTKLYMIGKLKNTINAVSSDSLDLRLRKCLLI